MARRFSTFNDKARALSAAKIMCERKQYISDAMFAKRFGVHSCVSKLLEAGCLAPTEAKGFYEWAGPNDINQAVSLLWKKNGIEIIEELSNETEQQVESNPGPSHDTPTLQDKIERAIEICTTYGIQNQSAFIADFLKNKIILN